MRQLLARTLLSALAVSIAGSGATNAAPLDLVRPSARTASVTADPAAGPLSSRDVGLYRRIFTYQDVGQWDRADALIARLDDQLLLGHVQQQRYMHPDAYRSSFEELSAWLERYGDHPGAERVYRLAQKRRPRGAAAPQPPVRGYLGGSGQERQEVTEVAYRSTRQRTAEEEALVRELRQEIEKLVRDRRPEAAAEQLRATAVLALLDRTEIDLARWQIAQAYLAAGDDLQALRLARRAAVGSGAIVPEIHWVAGISAWRRGWIDLATRHFTALALAEAAHPSERARAAFWAARAYVVAQKPQQVGVYLRIAAEVPQSFYGALARAALGLDDRYDWAHHEPKDALEAVVQFAGARRALALSQVGRRGLAEQEIRKLAGRAGPELTEGLIVLADVLDLPAAQMRLAQSLRVRRGLDHHDGLYPLPSWRPVTGFTVDRALLFAVIRAESGFDAAAESDAGARGLMQIMPATARYIADRAQLELPDHDGLFEPETGIMFGQAYLDEMLRRPDIDDNLMFVAIAYNAGPRRVAQWRKSIGMADPLLFLESLPLRETRIYVKKVMTNLWSYRDRLGQPQPSLKALAGNAWPIYRALDTKPELHAWN